MSQEASNLSVIAFLEHALERARKGELFYFAGAAGVATVSESEVQDFNVLVMTSIDPKVRDLDGPSIRNGLQATLVGVAHAAQSLTAHGTEQAQEAEARDRPRILM